MTKTCEICGKVFAVTDRNRGKKTCSLACRTQKHRMATIRSDIKTALKELGLEAHGNQIASHYAHAKEKHPYFCDVLLPELEHEEIRRHVQNVLTSIRKNLEGKARAEHVEWYNLLNCEVWEVLDAIANNDKAQAIEELYDCIAVCLRTIDVLKGWQKLGKPEAKGETK